jgi:hypothetical protein
LISSLLRRVVTTVQTAITKPPAAQPPPPTPAAAPYFQDTMEPGRPSPVNLSGIGNAPSAAVRALVASDVPASSGSAPVGPKLLHLETGWTPQGQGYDAKRDEVLTTYYAEGRGVLLSVQDKNSGSETHQVRLGGLSPEDPAGPPTHGGGVSTDGEFVYVSDTRHIYVYKREDIEKAEREGTEVNASQVMDVPQPEQLKDPATGIDLVSAGSYMTVKDGYAYIGAYSEGNRSPVGAWLKGLLGSGRWAGRRSTVVAAT